MGFDHQLEREKIGVSVGDTLDFSAHCYAREWIERNGDKKMAYIIYKKIPREDKKEKRDTLIYSNGKWRIYDDLPNFRRSASVYEPPPNSSVMPLNTH